VHFIPADDPREAAAVREVDLQRKYAIAPNDLAERVGLTLPCAVALRRELGIDDDDACVHEFVFGSQHHKRYSDNALRKMEEGVETLNMDEVWERNKPRRRPAKAAMTAVREPASVWDPALAAMRGGAGARNAALRVSGLNRY
jgi:hypothetical protein